MSMKHDLFLTLYSAISGLIFGFAGWIVNNITVLPKLGTKKLVLLVVSYTLISALISSSVTLYCVKYLELDMILSVLTGSLSALFTKAILFLISEKFKKIIKDLK